MNTPLLMCERHDIGDAEGVCTTVRGGAGMAHPPSKDLKLANRWFRVAQLV